MNVSYIEWEHITEKVTVTVVRREDYADTLLDMKGPITIDVFKKRCECKQCVLLPTHYTKFTLFINDSRARTHIQRERERERERDRQTDRQTDRDN